ncbi:MAG TPA: anthranilate phosphoribosyltransferase [Myxococcales bacterium]|nr:anthranilate phosphoribosyltransferase [Myxococcales bacterium]
MIDQALKKVAARQDLSREEMAQAMEEIADGTATPAQIGALLVGLRVKGETAEEILGAAQTMRARVDRVAVSREVFVDTCGTGGDGRSTFNISTAAAFVVAGAGVTVAKHGNRAVSSRCGSADVLVELGVNVDAPKAVVERCIGEVGIGFLFAPRLHPAFKAAAAIRRELGLRTVFNLLGPLANPALARHQVMGVFDGQWVPVLGKVLAALGSRRAFVVHGSGLDEISTAGPTQVAEVRGESVETYEISPESLGLERSAPEAITGGDAAHNARMIRDVLGGQEGPAADAVLANAAAALVAGGAAETLREGVVVARTSISSGAAAGKLEALAKASSEGAAG